MVPYRCSRTHGTIFNKNTIEEFRGCDKNGLMQVEGDRVTVSIRSGDWIDDPSLLRRFLVLSFACLKKFDFYYCFGFPAPLYDNVTVVVDNAASRPLNVNALGAAITDLADADLSFCVFQQEEEEEERFTYKPLCQLISKTDSAGNFAGADLESIYFAFSDPSTNEKPGWPLRVFIAALLHSW